MSTLKTQYKNWILKNPNSQLTYVNWLEKFNEIHNLPSDMSDWDVTLIDGLEDEPYVSDDFQIGPDGAYEHTEDMTKERKEIQPEDIWNKESQDKIKEHILNHANNQSSEDMLKTELAGKKYTEEDLENAFNSGRGYGVPDNIKDFNSFINSLNKRD